MAVNLSIKNAPEDIVARLRARAHRNHRSLQGELLAIIDAASREPDVLSVDELLARVRARGLRSASESVDMVREDRDAR